MARAKKAGVRKAASSGKAKASKVGASKADAGKAEANKPVASKKTKKAAKIEKKKVTKKKMVKRKAKQVANEQPTTEPVASMPVADSPAAESSTAQETAVKSVSAATGAAAEAKADGELNKSEWVRVYLETHPRAKAKDIVAALAEQGVTVTPGYAAGLRFKARMAKKKARRLAKKMVAESGGEPKASGSAARASADRFSLDSLLAAKKLAESLGGLEAARAAVAALVKLTG